MITFGFVVYFIEDTDMIFVSDYEEKVTNLGSYRTIKYANSYDEAILFSDKADAFSYVAKFKEEEPEDFKVASLILREVN